MSDASEFNLEAMTVLELAALRDKVHAKHLQKLETAKNAVLGEATAKLVELGATPLNPQSISPQVVTERTRTIDQIKRVYAVVMGFAVTTCFANVYKGTVASDYDQLGMVISFSEAFAFMSLATIFYLGSERVLDVRYLRPNSKVATVTGLLFDIFSLSLTSGWFVVLAETFPTLDSLPGGKFTASTIVDSQNTFVTNLAIAHLG